MNKINRVTASSWMLIALVITGCAKTEEATIKAYIDKNVEYPESIESSDSLEITNVSVCYHFKNNDYCQSIAFQMTILKNCITKFRGV